MCTCALYNHNLSVAQLLNMIKRIHYPYYPWANVGPDVPVTSADDVMG